MRCPSCSSGSGCVPEAAEPVASSINWADEQPLESTIEDAKVWRCSSCSSSFPSSDMPQDSEYACERLLPQVFGGDAEDAQRCAQRALELRRRVDLELGPTHWIGVLATFAWLQKCLTQLQSWDIIGFSEKDVQAGSAMVAKWLQDFAPLNSHQRLSALALTLRLASHLGGDMRRWGYDPSDPLQDGASKNAIHLLVQHGVSPATPDSSPSLAWDVHGGAGKNSVVPQASRRFMGVWKQQRADG